MVAGSRSSSGSRQSGRYNSEKDKKSNRKPNKKSKLDIIEIDKEIKQIENGELSTTHQMQKPTQLDLIKTIMKERSELTPEEKVLVNRPKPKPDWHLKQMAMTPSKSYSSNFRSNKDEKEKSLGE